MEIIKTDVSCPSCGELLCNLCGFNGYCQDCTEPIPPVADRKLRAFLKTKAKETGRT